MAQNNNTLVQEEKKTAELELMNKKTDAMEAMKKEMKEAWQMAMNQVWQMANSLECDDILVLISDIITELFPHSTHLYDNDSMAELILALITEEASTSNVFRELVRRECTYQVSMSHAIAVLNLAAMYYTANDGTLIADHCIVQQLRKLLDDAVKVESLFGYEHPLCRTYIALKMQATELINSVEHTE